MNGCTCGPPDIITGGDGDGPDPDCPEHGERATMHQPYDTPLFPVEDPAPDTVLGVPEPGGDL